MAWIDRVVEYPNRVKLTAVEGQENTYNMEASEGTVYVEGTLMNAENLNNETMNLIGEVVADGWNSSKSYAIGDSCIYNNALWNCLVANTNTEPTEGTHWTRVKLANADYVVERGTELNWDYVKWASGKCEAWRSISETVAFSGTLINNWYVKEISYNVPTFMTPITAIANGKWGTGYSWATVRNLTQVKHGNVSLCYFKNSSATDTAIASVYAYGTWK